MLFSHHCYILICLTNLGLENYIINLVPMELDMLLKIDIMAFLVYRTYCCRVVRKLLHVTHTDLDIAFATSMCTCFMTRPQALHLKATFKVFRYLKHTINLCLLYC
jgi:hypothetical protein